MHGAIDESDLPTPPAYPGPAYPGPEDPPLVGIFDSGLGGLTVVAALRRLAPALPLLYLGDTAWFPYGDRPEAEVRRRAAQITATLVEAGARLIVVACNTASSAALEDLRERFVLPIVGMEPPLKPAARRTRSGEVAVLATHGTAHGDRLARLQGSHADGVRVHTLPMPGLADRVERGEVDGPALEALLRADLAPLLGGPVDEVALGCTHYGFLRPLLERLLGPAVEVIDAAEPVARRALERLAEVAPAPAPLTAAPQAPAGHDAAVGAPAVRMLVTGDAAAAEAAVARLRAAGAALPPLAIAAATLPRAAVSR